MGEAPPSYMYRSEVAKRIWAYNPAIKIIVLLRNPIDRTYSQWNAHRERENESRTFGDAIRGEAERLRGTAPQGTAYLRRGFYTEQLQRLWRLFLPEQMLILKHETLRDAHEGALEGVFNFLGVEKVELPVTRANVGTYSAAMNSNDREFLREVFEAEIRSIEQLLTVRLQRNPDLSA